MCFFPSPPSYTPPNEGQSAEAARQAADAERRRLRAARGRQSTILTDPLGGTGAAAGTRKTLLGE